MENFRKQFDFLTDLAYRYVPTLIIYIIVPLCNFTSVKVLQYKDACVL